MQAATHTTAAAAQQQLATRNVQCHVFGRSRSSLRTNPPPKPRERRKPQDEEDQPSASTPGAASPNQGKDSKPAAKLPSSGYFAIADTKKEVYSKAAAKFDPTERSGRWKSDFIWNEKWQEQLQMEESIQRKYDAAQQAREQGNTGTATPSSSTSAPVFTSEAAAGSVSFSRLSQMDDIGADPTDLLLTIKEREAKRKAEQEERNKRIFEDRRRRKAEYIDPAAPRGGDQRGVPSVKRLGRMSRPAPPAIVAATVSVEDDEVKAQKAAEALEQYEMDKAGQRVWTAAFSVIGTGATYASYGREVCISYVVGALAGLLYLRLLGKSVDGLGGGGGTAGAVSQIGQPRLLIPLILALAYNRWNTTLADDYGLHLNFLAILVGFLTYKVAILAKQGKELADELSQPSSS